MSTEDQKRNERERHDAEGRGKGRLEGGDSPIIVGGGGSVLIDFDEGVYLPDNAGAPTYYEAAGRVIQRILCIDRKGVLQTHISVTAGTAFQIDLDVRDNGNVLRPIRIQSGAAGPVRITFAIGDYPVDATVGDRHFHAQRKMKRIITSTSNTLDDKGSVIVLDARV